MFSSHWNTCAVCCVVHHGCHILMPMSNKKFPLSKGWVRPKGWAYGRLSYAPMALKYASTYYVLQKYFYPIVCNTSAVCCAVLSTMGVTFLCQWAIKNSPCQKVGFDPLYYHSGRSTHRSHHFNFLLLKTSRYASWIMSCTISQFYSTPHWCVLPNSCLVS